MLYNEPGSKVPSAKNLEIVPSAALLQGILSVYRKHNFDMPALDFLLTLHFLSRMGG